MNTLAKIARNFDVIAVQEIRDASETTMPTYKSLINSMEGSAYDFIISQRLGRTSSKEQYAYLYNTETVEVLGPGFTFREQTGDVFHREPFIAPFKAKGGNFDFVLIVIHTDPDEATDEINFLPFVVELTEVGYPHEEDYIILGDLNADCTYFDEDNTGSLLRAIDFTWLINNSLDTTTKTTDCTYDRIVIKQETLGDYAGEAEVFRFDNEYGLTFEETTDVSDHYPVYAEFWIDRDTDFPP
jgi:endonuclease/exonuclease/phosphatase family metal-dependent hydrolase